MTFHNPISWHSTQSHEISNEIYMTNATNKTRRTWSAVLQIGMSATIWPVTEITFRELKPAIWTQDICTNNLPRLFNFNAFATLFTPWNAKVASPAFSHRPFPLLLAGFPWAIKNHPYFITPWADFHVNWAITFFNSEYWDVSMVMKEAKLLHFTLHLCWVHLKVGAKCFKMFFLHVVDTIYLYTL